MSKKKGKKTASCKALAEQLKLYRSAKELEWEKKKKMLNVGDFLRHFWGQKDASHKLQSHIVGAFRSARRKETVRKATPEERKRLECRANRSTALVWKAYPLVREMRLNDEETRFLLAYATGATLPDFRAMQLQSQQAHARACSEMWHRQAHAT